MGGKVKEGQGRERLEEKRNTFDPTFKRLPQSILDPAFDLLM
jgi:hypothetical protein